MGKARSYNAVSTHALTSAFTATQKAEVPLVLLPTPRIKTSEPVLKRSPLRHSPHSPSEKQTAQAFRRGT